MAGQKPAFLAGPAVPGQPGSPMTSGRISFRGGCGDVDWRGCTEHWTGGVTAGAEVAGGCWGASHTGSLWPDGASRVCFVSHEVPARKQNPVADASSICWAVGWLAQGRVVQTYLCWGLEGPCPALMKWNLLEPGQCMQPPERSSLGSDGKETACGAGALGHQRCIRSSPEKD